MYHYKECGLNNIYLENGYHIELEDQEEFTSVENVYGLHKVIGKHVINKQSSLKGEDIRFLRIELNMSQSALSDLLDTTSQTVARWEKEETAIPRATDILLRVLYLESIDEDSQVRPLLEMISNKEVEEGMLNIKFETEWTLEQAG